MAIHPKSITVNRAFLQEIKEDNQQLQQLLAELSSLAQHPFPVNGHYRKFSKLVCQLCDQLATHFALEEAYGYFEDAVDVAPRLSEAIQQLRNEHGDLFAEIRDLADCLDFTIVDSTSREKRRVLVVRFQQFVQRFEQHEVRERDLILGAYDDDIGVGD